jgi:diguanylate cyclase (GGDEF)-like protein/PAS domain S-box-containing protein
MALNSSFALVLAGTGFLGYEAIQYRVAATRELTTLADIVGAGTTGALSFSDDQAAKETLNSLRADVRISAAGVYDKTNRLLGSYRSANVSGAAAPSRPDTPGVYFEGGDLILFHPVVFQGERIGTVYLRSDLNEIRVRLLRYVGIVCIVLLVSLGLGLSTSSRCAGVISGPITDLAGLARRISVDKNYSVRASKAADDEVGVLIDSFNEMLSRIETRERDRKIAEDALRESEERYALAAHGANDGLWDWKLDTGAIYFSPRWTRMLGYSDEEIWSDSEAWSKPEAWFSRIHPADRDRVRELLEAHCAGSLPEFSAEYRIRHRNGTYIWMLSRGIAVRARGGVAFRIAGSQTDITEGKVSDALTELPNRLYFLDKLESAMGARGNPDARPFAVLFVDLDRFKVVNDSLGHAAGDQLLVGVAGRLRSGVRGPRNAGPSENGRLGRSPSTVARLGGDEFAILVEGLGAAKDATIVAERILKRLGAPFFIDGRQVFASASIGIAMSSSAETAEDLLRNADTAMYHAKSHGGGRCELFDRGMRERAIARMELEADLKRAIGAGEFVMYYQPKVSLADRHITGFEALIRWNHPARGLLNPGEFISIAEETGMIIPLGRWALREACRQMAEWLRTASHRTALTVSVNISFRQLAEEGLAEDIQRILTETGLNPASLEVEMTESSIMENAATAMATLQKLKELKIGLEIDDFGTGYSSLSYLRQLPFDTLKIDRSFVRELGSSGDSFEIVSTILQLARSMNLNVVAEGVENTDQLRLLGTMGCKCAQGFYFSKPVDADAARRLLEPDPAQRIVASEPARTGTEIDETDSPRSHDETLVA